MHRRSFLSFTAVSGLAALGGGLLRPERAFAGACAPPTLNASYVTQAGQRVARGGGVLVGTTVGFGGTGYQVPDPLVDDAYTLTQGETTTPLRAQHLAPGLLRLVPTTYTPGPGTVRGPAGELAVVVADTNARAPAPVVVRKLELERHPGSQNPYSPETWSIVGALRGALPSDAVGVLVAAEAASAPYGLFVRASAGQQSIGLYGPPARCQVEVPGVLPMTVGHAYRLTVVAASGAVSVRSNHVRVED